MESFNLRYWSYYFRRHPHSIFEIVLIYLSAFGWYFFFFYRTYSGESKLLFKHVYLLSRYIEITPKNSKPLQVTYFAENIFTGKREYWFLSRCKKKNACFISQKYLIAKTLTIYLINDMLQICILKFLFLNSLSVD